MHKKYIKFIIIWGGYIIIGLILGFIKMLYKKVFILNIDGLFLVACILTLISFYYNKKKYNNENR